MAHLKLERASQAHVWATKLYSATQTTFYILLTPNSLCKPWFPWDFESLCLFQPCLANFRMILPKRWSQSKRYQTLGAMEVPGITYITYIYIYIYILGPTWSYQNTEVHSGSVVAPLPNKNHIHNCDRAQDRHGEEHVLMIPFRSMKKNTSCTTINRKLGREVPVPDFFWVHFFLLYHRFWWWFFARSFEASVHLWLP